MAVDEANAIVYTSVGDTVSRTNRAGVALSPVSLTGFRRAWGLAVDTVSRVSSTGTVRT